MDDEILSMNDVVERTGLKPSVVIRMIVKRHFPSPVLISGWEKWWRSEVDEWLKQRRAGERHAA